MKITKCDKCGVDNAKTYRYDEGRNITYTDLCLNCMQDFVISTKIRLVEANGISEKIADNIRKIIHG